MKSSRTTAIAGSFMLAFSLCAACLLAAAPSLSAQAVALADVCLVYNTRSTFKLSGYDSYSSSSSGILVVGPEFIREVDGHAGARVAVKMRRIQPYSFFTRSSPKYYLPEVQEDRIVGAFNFAKAGSSKPSISLALTEPFYARSSLETRDTIGKASWRSPYTGVAPGWLATSLSSSIVFYDLNPDRDGEDSNAPSNYLGQLEPEYLPCLLVSGKTTYTLDSRRSQSVKDLDFDQACEAVEAALDAAGFERMEGFSDQEP